MIIFHFLESVAVMESWWSPFDIILATMEVNIDSKASEWGGDSKLEDTHKNGATDVGEETNNDHWTHEGTDFLQIFGDEFHDQEQRVHVHCTDGTFTKDDEAISQENSEWEFCKMLNLQQECIPSRETETIFTWDSHESKCRFIDVIAYSF